MQTPIVATQYQSIRKAPKLMSGICTFTKFLLISLGTKNKAYSKRKDFP